MRKRSRRADTFPGFFLGMLALTVVLLLTGSVSGTESKRFGGITFSGERQGICVEIDGECGPDAISFELATCDENMVEKDKYKERMPFTLLVPEGTHNLVIKRNGQVVKNDQISISAEQVLEYKLP